LTADKPTSATGDPQSTHWSEREILIKAARANVFRENSKGPAYPYCFKGACPTLQALLSWDSMAVPRGAGPEDGRPIARAFANQGPHTGTREAFNRAVYVFAGPGKPLVKISLSSPAE
jgi:hypothetical protein